MLASALNLYFRADLDEEVRVRGATRGAERALEVSAEGSRVEPALEVGQHGAHERIGHGYLERSVRTPVSIQYRSWAMVFRASRKSVGSNW